MFIYVEEIWVEYNSWIGVLGNTRVQTSLLYYTMETLWTHIYLIGKALQQDAMQTQLDSLVEKIKDMERVMKLIFVGLGIDTSSHL